MNFASLTYFVTAVNEKSFSKASEKLFLSQQALSKHIAQMEKQYNTVFLIRKPQLELTESGKLMYQFATQCLQQEQKMRLDFERLQIPLKNHITVGIGLGHSQMMIQHIYAFYKERNMYPMFKLIVDSSEALAQYLSTSKIDLFIGYAPKDAQSLTMEPLIEDELVLIIHSDLMSSLFPDNTAEMVEKYQLGADLRAFLRAPFLTLPHGSRIRGCIDEYFDSLGIHPNIALESVGSDFLLKLALQGQGVAICPKSLTEYYGQALITDRKTYFFPIRLDNFPRQMIAAYPSTHLISVEGRAVIDAVRYALSKLGLPLLDCPATEK